MAEFCHRDEGPKARSTIMKLYTFPGNMHAYQSLIIARYNGIDIEVPAFEMGKDNQTPAFLAMSPLGKVPVLETAQGPLCEAAAIARYVARMRADTNMYGGSFYEAGLVDQWIEFAKSELDLPVGMWIYPLLGFITSNASNEAKAKEDVSRALKVLNSYLVSHTFLAGEGITAADVVVSCSLVNAFKLVFDAAFMKPFPAVVRWFTTCVAQPEFLDVLGPTALKMGDASAVAAPAPKADKKPKEEKPKEEKKAKEEKPKEEKPKGGKPSGEEIEKMKAEKAAQPKKEPEEKKKEEPMSAEEKAAKEAAKAKDKLLKTVIKEGGKKGVEIEGAAEMGGLDFFCTTIESPEGDQSLLLTAMQAMNADPDPLAEERKGCSGFVGKMIFSAGTAQLAIVAYVPKPESNKSAEKVDVTEWIKSVAAAVGGTVTNEKIAAPDTFVNEGKPFPCPHGGHFAEAVVVSNPEAGKYAIKDKDTAMAAAFDYLRKHGAFPEDTGDDEDDMVFGDDDDLSAFE